MSDVTLTKAPREFSMEIISNDASYVAPTGAIQIEARTGNRWQLSMVWVVDKVALRTIGSQLDQLQGKRNRLLVAPYALFKWSRSGVGGGTPLVNGSNSAGATTLALKGLPSSVTGVLMPGDYLMVGNQLVRVVTQMNSSGTTGTVAIRPELHKNYADGTAVNYATPSGKFIMVQEPAVGWDIDGIVELNGTFVEDVLA